MYTTGRPNISLKVMFCNVVTAIQTRLQNLRIVSSRLINLVYY